MSTAKMLALAAALSVAPLAKGELIHHWKLDESSGTTALNSIGGINGVLGGASAWAAGRLGNGFKTSGSTLGYVNNGNVPLTNTFSLSFWVKPEDVTLDWRNMVSKHDGPDGSRSFWVGQKDTDGYMRFGLYFNGTTETPLDTSAAVIASGQWSLVTAMWDESSKVQSLYVNGQLAASAVRSGQSFAFPRSSNLLFSTNNMNSGTVVGVGSWARFPGTLDDVAIWNSILTPGQIKAMASAPAVDGIAHYHAGNFRTLFAAHDTNFAFEIGTKRWTRVTGLGGAEGSIATVPNGHTIQFTSAGTGVAALSRVSLTADPTHPNLATGGKVDIFDHPSGRISEVDPLISNESIGSANFRPFQTSPGDIYAMLWLTDLVGSDDRSLLRAELAAVGGGTYDLLSSSDPAWAQLQANHAGFDTLIRFNNVEIGGAFNWDFASRTDVRIDQIAIVTTGAPVPEPSGILVLAAVGALLRRSRR
ncbi:MAG: LamG domain-containing protein [Phycisphaerae bacterium]|nr:LamG domain-containing protein [Phycisphaerae bacterium]MDW8261208.1 LamG domain-containing protein [Phycisphaerales bacterium]